MKSIFTRTYIVTTALLFVSIIATIIIADNLFETADSEYFIQEALLEAKYVEAEVRSQPAFFWEAWVDAYQPILEHTVELVSKTGEDELQLGEEFTFSGVNAEYWSIRYPLNGYDKTLIVSESEDSIANIPADDWLELLIPIGIIFVILAFSIYSLARKITKPINELLQVTKAFTDGDLSARVNEKVPHPIDDLSIGFNQMAERMQRLIRDQKILIGALPHELRSPIGRIRFALDVTRDLDSVNALRGQIEKIDAYTDDLHEISEDILTLIRLQTQEISPTDTIDLYHLIESLAECDGAKSDIDISWSIDSSRPVYGNRALIRRALANLVDNACRYAKASIVITAKQSGANIELTVDDDGPGIAAENREMIFSPFSRIDHSRTRKFGGIGLGLALVDMIMQKHNGSTRVSSSPLGGARFQLTWEQKQVMV